MDSGESTDNAKIMKLLNVGCGGQRPHDEPWINLDTLRTQLEVGTPERTNLDKEENYVECDLLKQSIPFHSEYFDGILLQHVLEHFTCHDAVDVIIKCRAVLKPGGVLVASVPNADYFLQVYDEDTRETAVELFGENISGDWHDSQCKKFFDYALFHRGHKQVLNLMSLSCLLLRAGFANENVSVFHKDGDEVARTIDPQLNRLKFSSILYAYK